MILAHERIGSGEPLLLVHGLGSAATIWKPLLPLISDTYEVITVDLPGHGHTRWIPGTPMDPASLARHVAETLDAIGVERVHAVGNSLGGWTVLELAAAAPTRIRSVVGLAPAGMRDQPLTSRDRNLTANRRLARLLRPTFPILLRSERLRSIGFAQNSPIWRTWSYEACRDAAWAMASAQGYDDALTGTFGRVAECAKRIPGDIPLRVIFGDTDNVLPASTSQSRAYLPAHGTWEIWERCGHAIQLDYPDRVATAIRAVCR
jgi:pimeloyl-ACP methyl ester carboxylesterase